MLVYVYSLAIAFAPMLLLFGIFSAGNLIAVLSSITSATSTITSMTEVREGLRIAALLLGRMASLLNESRYLMLRRVRCRVP